MKTTTSIEDLKETDFVIEAVFENFEVKRKSFLNSINY